MALYEVEVSAPEDSAAENNRKRVAVAHSGRPKVLVIDKNPTQAEPLAQALRASDFDVETRPPTDCQRISKGSKRLIDPLSEAPAADLGRSDEDLEKWVKDFGGIHHAGR
jgi:hypothetical protein